MNTQNTPEPSNSAIPLPSPAAAYPQLERAVSNPLVKSVFGALLVVALAYISNMTSQIYDRLEANEEDAKQLNDRVVELEKLEAVHRIVHENDEKARVEQRARWLREFELSQKALRMWTNAPDPKSK